LKAARQNQRAKRGGGARRVVIHAAVFDELEWRQIASSHPLSVSRMVTSSQSSAVTRPAMETASAWRPWRR
jgi:hypothetical protein